MEKQSGFSFPLSPSNPVDVFQNQAAVITKKPTDYSSTESFIKPNFTRDLVDVTASIDDRIQFVAEIVAKPAALVTWFKNDKVIQRGENFRYTKDGNLHILTALYISVADEGIIKCKAVNNFGQATSSAKLLLEGNNNLTCIEEFREDGGHHDNEFSSIYAQSLNLTHYEESTFSLSNVIALEPIISTDDSTLDETFKSKKKLRHSRLRKPQATKSELPIFPKDKEYFADTDGEASEDAKEAVINWLEIIRKMIKEELNSYETLQIHNKEHDVQKEVDQGVPMPPVFIKDLIDCRVEEDETAHFVYILSGTPTPSVQWLKNGERVKQLHDENSYCIITDYDAGCLIIRSTNREHSATYSCLASNCHGSAASSALLEIVNRSKHDGSTSPPAIDASTTYADQKSTQVWKKTVSRKTQTLQEDPAHLEETITRAFEELNKVESIYSSELSSDNAVGNIMDSSQIKLTVVSGDTSSERGRLDDYETGEGY